MNKPATWTSLDVVNFVRSRFNVPKVGHCGTLDPAATGLLLLVLGKFTTLSGKLSGVDKQYTGTLTLGVETDSGDLDGKVILMHGIYSSTAEATAYLVPYLQEQGYDLVTVSELVEAKHGEMPENSKIYGYHYFQ